MLCNCVLCAGLQEVKVESMEEALLLLRMGVRHRHVASTYLNYQSSRSHTIFTIKMIKVLAGADKPHSALVNRSDLSHTHTHTHTLLLNGCCRWL